MANHVRMAKSDSDCGDNELLSYRIVSDFQDVATFFGSMPALPEPDIDTEVWTAPTRDDALKDENYTFLLHMDLAARVNESAVVDFAKSLLERLGFVCRGRAARTRVELPLEMCGQKAHANPDIVLFDINRSEAGVILLVQEDKRQDGPHDPLPQLMAEAIAAYQWNNHVRVSVGDPPLSELVRPAVTKTGTMPTFYKIPLTAQLVQAVMGGTYPTSETSVACFIPPLPRPHRRWSEGMKPLDNRRIVLQCFEAFKQFV